MIPKSINLRDGNTIKTLDEYYASLDWDGQVTGLLKGELARRSLTYEDLAKMLNKMGSKESAANLRNKINRGTFSATFLLQCLTALNVNLEIMGPFWYLKPREK